MKLASSVHKWPKKLWKTYHAHKHLHLCISISNGLSFRQAFTGNKQRLFARIFPISVNGADKRKTPVSCYHTGQHSKMPVKHVISSCTVAVNGLVQETINAVEPEFAAHGYANVKADVSTMTTLRQNCFYIPSDSPSKEDTVYNCECSLNRHIYENKMYYENNTGWPKNLPPFFSIRLNFNSNRYLTLFHSRYQEKSCNNTVAKNLTTSQVCRYSTL